MKHILKKFWKLLKTKIIEKKFQTCWKKYLQAYWSIKFCIKKEKTNQTKYNIDMPGVNFMVILH